MINQKESSGDFEGLNRNLKTLSEKNNILLEENKRLKEEIKRMKREKIGVEIELPSESSINFYEKTGK